MNFFCKDKGTNYFLILPVTGNLSEYVGVHVDEYGYLKGDQLVRTGDMINEFSISTNVQMSYDLDLRRCTLFGRIKFMDETYA